MLQIQTGFRVNHGEQATKNTIEGTTFLTSVETSSFSSSVLDFWQQTPLSASLNGPATSSWSTELSVHSSPHGMLPVTMENDKNTMLASQ